MIILRIIGKINGSTLQKCWYKEDCMSKFIASLDSRKLPANVDKDIIRQEKLGIYILKNDSCINYFELGEKYGNRTV